MVAKAITSIRQHSRRRNLPAIYHEGSHWCQGWYFDLRLEEELARSIRYGLPFSLVVVFLTEEAQAHRDRQLLTQLLSDMAARALRRSDIPAVLEDNESAISLPHTNARQAEVVAKRLAKGFAPYPTHRHLQFPEDGQEPGQLLVQAEHRALANSSNASAMPQAIRKRRSSPHA